ncbi:putative polyketide synthase [Aspergillus recurvatus]
MGSHAGNTLLLFGPQSLSFNKHSFDELRSTVSEGRLYRWIPEAVAELPTYWTVVCQHLPQLKSLDGEHWLADLDRWFRTGRYPETNPTLPNTLLTPLVVLTQLAQYARSLELGQSFDATVGSSNAFSVPPNASTLGFCTGVLSAFAVSSSASQEDFAKYGAVAVRLAMLIGALVDAQDASDEIYGRAKSYATAWNSAEQGADLSRIIDQFPEAYISVRFDDKRATITTSQNSAQTLVQHLKAAGIVATEVGLRGRFHYPNYHAVLEPVNQLCDAEPAFQFPSASDMILPSYTNQNGEPIRTGSLHQLALYAILVQESNWYNTFATVQASLLENEASKVISFGPNRCVPPSLMRTLGSRLVQAMDLDWNVPRLSTSALDPNGQERQAGDPHGNDIAVIGMAIKVAGADDLAEFWQINCEGKSQHIEVPESRFGFQTQWRELDTKRKWYGNFIDNRSPREAASMDPQQRLLLQTAYQAVEQSGYFALPDPDNRIGCYIGACAADYEHNIACHPPNAFTATGNLRSFMSGKISHYFGWTGTGMTIDTACSASAVAIHMACQAILSGECTGGALAGGVATMSNPLWFQNLAGATFLSTTGQCKPFDELADGYCRGEGIACVFLKKMSSAIADGNQIFGCISGTAVSQNQNCTPIFVPNSPSLSSLFREVVHKAHLQPDDISVVEAHGTGTPVGDPAEYESILQALGGSNRSRPLWLGSVKGLVGHTEGTSGVISLIKVLMMMHEGRIPPQASYAKLSHHIQASPKDLIEIPTRLHPWNEEYKAALINNYGASGSNASMVVTQFKQRGEQSATIHSVDIKHPFWISALDEKSLSEYCRKLSLFIRSDEASIKPTTTISNLSFNLSRQMNRTLPRALIFSCSSLAELESQLSASSVQIKATRPVVLCFGGQISTFIGLDRKVYETTKVFRTYLDQCDAAIRSLGLDSIYPEIFQQTPIEDTVKLQTALFAMQYSCAKCWMDSGVAVAAIVGHSFGEITGLCVSGVLSLQDTVKLVASRAKLVRDLWGEDTGAMMAVEGDLVTVEQLITEVNQAGGNSERPASIACYNGPRSFTLAGGTKSIERVSEILAHNSTFGSLKAKRLNVTNAFHSALVEPLIPSLEKLGQDLIFKKPVIPLERATESHQPANNITSNFIAEHLRRPVYFNHALQRLAQQYPSSIWLEAGSNSTITHMANRALGSSADAYFQAVNLSGDRALQNLTDTTVSLWKEGLRISFWPHHALQTYDYCPLILPPYQFEKHRHWLDLKVPQPVSESAPIVQEKESLGLWSFVGYQDAAQLQARFRINTMTQQYSDFVSGHLIAQTAPICPATLEIDMAIEAIRSLHPDLAANHHAQIFEMQNYVPICVDPSLMVWLDFETLQGESNSWTWKIVSHKGSETRAAETVHVKGKIRLCATDDPSYHAEFARYERMVSHKRCLTVLRSDDDADDVIQGRNVYRTFAEVVDYGEMYRGVKKVVGKGDECAGRVQMRYADKTWLDVILSDCFSQVGGLWVNAMTDRASSDMYLASGCDVIMRSPKLDCSYERPEIYDILATHHRESDKLFLTDVYVFDATNGQLLEVMFGIHYIKVAKASMSKILTRLTAPEAMPSLPSTAVPITTETAALAQAPSAATTKLSAAKAKSTKKTRPDLSQQVRDIIANVSGLEADEIKDDSELADFGIDSLMGMELAREVESVFKCTLDQEELMEATSFRKFVKCITAAVYPEGAEANDDSDDADSTENSESESPSSTPRTSATDVTPGGTPSNEIKVEPLSRESPLKMSPSTILDAFGESKMITDQFMRDHKINTYADMFLPNSTQLCVALVLEAFETLGISISSIPAGKTVPRVNHVPQHGRLVRYLYEMLENDGRLIDTKGGQHIRTAISPPKKSSDVLLQDLLKKLPEWTHASKLTYFAGKALADVLQGKTDGIRLIFGSTEGRELVTALYCDDTFNRTSYEHMRDFLGRLISKLPVDDGPLKILEMGAGTGGSTLIFAPFLAQLNIPVEYTFTDLSPSMVAQARRRFKGYPFMKFAVHDIEKPPAEELRGQHIVIASNAVHATHNLVNSAQSIRTALRPDGFLMMLEMTAIVPYIELIFGLLEGWWLFDDGRRHAIAPAPRWEKDLQSAGFGHVDWTDGSLPENNVQKIIIALASGPTYNRLPKPMELEPQAVTVDDLAREAEVNRYVTQFSDGFSIPAAAVSLEQTSTTLSGQCVLLTGATGSLGSHLVEQFAIHPDVHTVVCVNRRGGVEAKARQQQALTNRGIVLNDTAQAKLKVIETDTSKPKLGVSDAEYIWLVQHVTHIVHNAWPMSGTRPIRAFEQQFQALRNLIDFARDIASQRPASGFKVRFQLVSSIGVVGQYPLWSGQVSVPEERMEMRSVLPVGYCEAKLACERILEATLHKYPEYFHPMSARLGQIAGSRTSGYWNPIEHFSFLVKSCQSLRALPNFDGILSWVPVNDVAATLSDLLLAPADRIPYPIYHIDNPKGQPWPEMIEVLADALDVPRENIIPFDRWVRRVRESPLSIDTDNPAGRLIDFLDHHFLRMSCGGLLLDTTRTREHSLTLAAQGPVSAEVARKYVKAWKEMGFLHAER